MRISLVYNPAAASGEHVDALVSLLTGAGHEVRRSSRRDGLRDLLQDPGDLLVAAGGDGTVREVALAAAERGLPFSALPIGMANNIAKTLGMVGDASDLIATWSLDPRPELRLDIGEADGPWGSRRFVEGVGGGLIPELITRGAEVEDPAVRLGRETDRALLLLDELLSAAAVRPWQLRVDGVDLSGEYLAVEVLNVRFVGPNVPLAPEANLSDGALDVVLVGEADREPMRRYLNNRLQLASGVLPRLRQVRASRVQAIAPGGVRLRIDDEPWPQARPLDQPTPVDMRCLAAAVTMVGSVEGHHGNDAR